ncbi:MAG: hypothetical protein KGH99_00525 [Thaumarchaeota archaeon]|nr:hypothetical protein [Nitrososphaerota archaeon]MDE1871945.1 hypothetical protein [Nitrososphaerota archaeon]
MRYIIPAILAITVLLVSGLAFPASQAMAPAQNLVPENDVVMQKSVINMNIPADPKLPYGCVWGTVQNAAPGYPVDIEIYKNGKPVYFAQANVTSDGSYQKYFRVMNVDHAGHITNIFEGDYTVEIFKYVVNSTSSATST